MSTTRHLGTLVLAGAATVVAAGTAAQTAKPHRRAAAVAYVARLHPMNTKVTGKATTGTVRFTQVGDSLTIRVDVRNAPPDMQHWQHFHGFTTGRRASCPAMNADRNHDGIIDVTETEAASGTTMVPFNDDPVSLQVATDTYPSAAGDGSYHYEKTVSLSALEAAFAKQFKGQKLDLDHRVVYVHGVPESAALPASVASLGPIPARTTLPIACGRIERAAR